MRLQAGGLTGMNLPCSAVINLVRQHQPFDYGMQALVKVPLPERLIVS